MPETPEELWARAHDALRTPPLAEWETWPFDGDLRPRALAPPEAAERPRNGEGGVDCWRCARGDEGAIWSNERWLLSSLGADYALPVIVLLEPRAHYAEPGDLPEDVASELGVLLTRVERAVRSIGEIGRVHVCRWGDGSEHLHWWFLARPARIPQLIGSFAAIWDDVLPPLPARIRQANLDAVVVALSEGD